MIDLESNPNKQQYIRNNEYYNAVQRELVWKKYG